MLPIKPPAIPTKKAATTQPIILYCMVLIPIASALSSLSRIEFSTNPNLVEYAHRKKRKVDVINANCMNVPVVVDPVIFAKGGASLLDDDAVIALKENIVPMATLLTPNIPEAEALAGMLASHKDQAETLARHLLTLGARSVLLKGGHRDGDVVHDLLIRPSGAADIFSTSRINTVNTHGTGCTLASAIAVGLAQGMELHDAVRRGRNYVVEAIRTAPGFGQGHGPLNHTHPLTNF